MGDIGHEIAPCRFQTFPARDIAPEQQFVVLAIRHLLHGKHHFTSRSRHSKSKWITLMVRGQMLYELWLPRYVVDQLAAVTLIVEAKISLRAGIAPFNAVAPIQNDDCIGELSAGEL